TAADVAPGDVVELGTTKLRLLRLRRFPDAAAGAALRVGWRGSERLVPVHDGLVIGRQPECDVHLDDATVSRRHAIVHAADGTFEIEDLQSANGTRVGGRPVRGRTVLRDGGVVEVGTARATLTFVEGPSGLGPVTV